MDSSLTYANKEVVLTNGCTLRSPDTYRGRRCEQPRCCEMSDSTLLSWRPELLWISRWLPKRILYQSGPWLSFWWHERGTVRFHPSVVLYHSPPWLRDMTQQFIRAQLGNTLHRRSRQKTGLQSEYEFSFHYDAQIWPPAPKGNHLGHPPWHPLGPLPVGNAHCSLCFFMNAFLYLAICCQISIFSPFTAMPPGIHI